MNNLLETVKEVAARQPVPGGRPLPSAYRNLDPTILVIFGITGDLAQRKLLPALYHLVKDNLLHEKTRIVGISRRNIALDELLGKTELCVLETDKVCDPVALKRLRSILQIHTMDLTNSPAYDKLLGTLNAIEHEEGVCMNRLYYLSIPPQIFSPIVRHLGEHGLNASCPHGNAATRLLVEKPFGYDLTSAKELINETGEQFNEHQIFRIDHYLAKETVQNILTFRFENPLFESLWNNQHVQDIDIIASEKIDIEGRATFYDQIGALRDLIQSHLLQLLALVTMEHPEHMTSDAIHAAKLQLLKNVEPIPRKNLAERVHRGQYEGYRDEVGNSDSSTETFASLKLFIDNPRWRGTPITLRTGKALAEKKTTITLTFAKKGKKTKNIVTFNLQPNEGIGIELLAKRPGFEHQLDTVDMNFHYQQSFTDHGHPDAYERVLVDAIRGDHTLFATSEEVLASWRIVEPAVQAWSANSEGLQIYKRNTPIKRL